HKTPARKNSCTATTAMSQEPFATMYDHAAAPLRPSPHRQGRRRPAAKNPACRWGGRMFASARKVGSVKGSFQEMTTLTRAQRSRDEAQRLRDQAKVCRGAELGEEFEELAQRYERRAIAVETSGGDRTAAAPYHRTSARRWTSSVPTTEQDGSRPS